MIYLLAATKGGVGKSTLAVTLAAWLAQTGKTLLIDADKQQSAASWMSWRHDRNMKHNPEVVMLQGDMVFKQGKVLAGNYNDTIIDAGGRDSSSLRFSLLCAERVIAPISASNFDTSAWDDFFEAYEAAKTANEKLDLRVVMARIHSGRSEKRTNDLRRFMEEQGVRVLDTIIPEAVAFVDANGEGIAVFERGVDDKASFSARKFCKEVIQWS